MYKKVCSPGFIKHNFIGFSQLNLYDFLSCIAIKQKINNKTQVNKNCKNGKKCIKYLLH